MPTTDAAEGLTYSAEAYAAVEKAVESQGFYAPIVLAEAAELLTDLWAAGARRGVAPADWASVVNLAVVARNIVTKKYGRFSDPEGTMAKAVSPQGHLITALEEFGLTARISGPVIVDRGPDTPRGGFHGDADIEVHIYIDGGWAFAFAEYRAPAPVAPIVAPATEVGASQVADIIRAFVRGELGDIFRC
ncbi:hypothetical protein OHB07_38135 [Streptomyces sp. NBC_00111]|uniref:hypothetical protein n=1 Tax=Streptomyces sp. NBC_00111 TaxID=2975655 RepID=UPI00325427DC